MNYTFDEKLDKIICNEVKCFEGNIWIDVTVETIHNHLNYLKVDSKITF